MSIVSNKDRGGENSKFPFNHAVLKGLQQIADNTNGNASTLISMLSAIKAHQDMEILLVRDDSTQEVVQQIREYDETTDTWSTSYVDVSGAAYTFTGNPEYLDADAVLNLLLTEMQSVSGDDGTAHGAGQSGQRAMGSDGTNDVQVAVDSSGHPQVDILTMPAVTQALGTTSSLSNVAASASNVTLKVAAINRISLKIFNDADTNLYIKEGTTASTSSFTYKLLPGEFIKIDDYNGVVDGIWDGSPTGNARVTETT